VGAERILKVSPAFSKAVGFQRAKPFGRASRRETPWPCRKIKSKIPLNHGTAFFTLLPRMRQTGIFLFPLIRSGKKENTCLPLARQKREKSRAVLHKVFLISYGAAGDFAPAGATKGLCPLDTHSL